MNESENLLAVSQKNQSDSSHASIVLVAATGLAGGWLPEPRPAVLPPNGPQDLRVYATLHAIWRSG